MRLPETTRLSSTVVVPLLESRVRFPDDVVTVLPSIVILSTSTEVRPFKSVWVPPSDITSVPIVMEEFVRDALAILVKVLLLPSIDLFVKVSVDDAVI